MVFILLSSFISSIGQNFHAKIIFGINASQLEGDNLSGFNKVGLHSGLGVQYTLGKYSLVTELLFNQKGSSSAISASTGQQRIKTNLNYLQIPVLISFNQWYSEEDRYYRISLEAGPYYGRLFSVSSSNSVFESLTDQFRKTDLGLVLGARYRFVNKWSAALRYDQSFLRIFKDQNSNLTGLLSYLVTFRIEYHL